MKLFKCKFCYIGRGWHNNEIRYIFSQTGDKEKILERLTQLCCGHDDLISGLTIEEFEPYEGMVF